MAIKVGVLGAAGKMGQTVCGAVEGDGDTELVARVDPAGIDGTSASLDALTDAGAEVVVDFTQPSSVKANALWCLDKGIHCVIGTTGLSAADLDELAAAAKKSGANVFVAPNFSLGAVMMMHLSQIAAKYFGSAEVIEMHHNQKLDAPSGTALKTAREIEAVWESHGRPPGGTSNPNEEEIVAGARGADVDGVHVHSVRMLGGEAHQEVIFGAIGQTLTIRHDAMNRQSYMPGVMLAVKSVGSRPGLTVGLENLLDI